MDIKSIVNEVMGMGKEVMIEAVSTDEDGMQRIVSCLRDISVLKVNYNQCALPDNRTRITLRLSLQKGTTVEEWMGVALETAFEKTTLNFDRKQ